MIGLQVSRPTFAEAWFQLLHHLLTAGRTATARDLGTRELLAVSLVVEDLRQNVLVHPVRDLNYRFMVAEWLWILAGRDDVEGIARFNRRMREFSDDGVRLAGAYGPRLATQWDWVLENLSRTDTRQAVAVVWSPCPRESRDIPCTLTLQFLVRRGYLDLVATMRSSDVWLGLPYDVFTFSQLANLVAGQLGVGTRSLVMQLGSSHLYEEHLGVATQVLINANDLGTLRSPALEKWPDRQLVNSMLNREYTTFKFDKVWDEYRKVLLAKSRLEALRTLTELGRFT